MERLPHHVELAQAVDLLLRAAQGLELDVVLVSGIGVCRGAGEGAPAAVSEDSWQGT